jgi:hypothetical protein
MGGSISTHCRNCNETEQFTTGIGFCHSSLDKAIRCTSGNVKKRLQVIVSNHSITDADYEHRVLGCSNCNTLHERFWVRVKYDGDKIYETRFRCGKCRTGLVDMDKSIEEYCCSNCGGQSLEEFPGINWD